MKREGFYIRLGVLGFTTTIAIGYFLRSYAFLSGGLAMIVLALFGLIIATGTVMFLRSRFGEDAYSTSGEGIGAIAPVIGIALVVLIALFLGVWAGG